MGELGGFLRYERETAPRRPVPVRVRDWREVYEELSYEKSRIQGARCMDCGIPFCHDACPLGNLIPEWNDFVYKDDWFSAIERLHATNNFPDFTGRLCPAPCEGACVLGIASDPVAIKQLEHDIIERAFKEGWVKPHPSRVRTGKRVAVVGSGPAGLACAQQLTRAGHEVVVFERAQRIGGLLRYGIPEFKLEKAVLDRRLEQMRAEGTEFRVGVAVGSPTKGASEESSPQSTLVGPSAPFVTVQPAKDLLQTFDAVVLATGSTVPRDLPLPGRELKGIHFAMEYLKHANLVQESLRYEDATSTGAALGPSGLSSLDARGKKVVILGGGDTGADCLGTAHRQGAAHVVQMEIMPPLPPSRAPDNPWPTWPVVFSTSAAHEEGGERVFGVETTEFIGDGEGEVVGLRARHVELVRADGKVSFVPQPGSEFELECDLVVLALGFVGSERSGVVDELGLALTERGSVMVDDNWATNVEGVFACGDASRGQSLVVWAIAEGRSAAASVDRYLMGETALPAPLVPGQVGMR